MKGFSPLAQARYSKAFGLVATARLHWQEAGKAVAESHRRRPATLTEEERASHRLSLALSGEAAEEAVSVARSLRWRSGVPGRTGA